MSPSQEPRRGLFGSSSSGATTLASPRRLQHSLNGRNFKDLVVLERAEPALVEAVTKPLAMAFKVRHRYSRPRPSRKAAFR